MSSRAHRLEAVPEPTSLRDQVAACGNQWAAAQHQLVNLVVALDDSGEWQGCGFPTCAHWVASALDIEVSTVREWLRIGRKLSALPAIAAAYATGALSYSKVRSLTRVATADNEVDLCEIARRVPAGRLAHALAAWLARNETPTETEARHLGARRMSWRLEPDGMIIGKFSLPPLAAAPVTAAIDMELVRSRPTPDASADASPRWPSIAQQRADAFVRLMAQGGARSVTEIVVHVRGDGVTLDDGTPITESALERIAPTSFVRALIHDAEGRPINASARRRHPSVRQRRVVKERDRECVNCGGEQLLEYHHEPAFEHTGRTLVDELELRCATCHREHHANETPG